MNYQETHDTIVKYLRANVDRGDWHAVSDAALGGCGAARRSPSGGHRLRRPRSRRGVIAPDM